MTIQQDILAEIKQYETIIIHRHQRPDPDAFGSQLGLKAILSASFPDKKIYAVGKNVPGLAWIGEMDVIEDKVYRDALVIVTDTANSPRVDDLRYDTGRELIKIDHHPNDEPYGDWFWVEAGQSATSTMIYQFYEQLADELTLTKEAARLLYIGIAGDTGRFNYGLNTETMRVVGELLKMDVDYPTIHQRMDTISQNAAKLAGYVLQNVTVLDSGFAYFILTNEMIEAAELGEAGTAFVVPLPAKIDRVKAWAIFEQQDEGNYRVRLRSRSIVINTIAKQFEGGGHPLASGAWAQNERDVTRLIETVDAALQAAEAAKEN
ncbi:MAG TPA: bifunctional oligoribonuclease/PAP phosphatase NrnA [Lactobacillaceae bacterium]|jgi:phosphoesterase RecJ-like protein